MIDFLIYIYSFFFNIDLVEENKMEKTNIKIENKIENKVENKKIEEDLIQQRIKEEQILKEIRERERLKVIKEKEEAKNQKINEYKLKSFKDELFNRKWDIIENKYNWDYKVISYSQKRDLEERDEISVDKVWDEYVKIISKKDRKDIREFDMEYIQTKNNKTNNDNIKYIVLYFHWMAWNKTWWAKDYTFWWNFNRIQNLAIENQMVYISPTLKDFNNKWVKDIYELIKRKQNEFRNAKIILTAGSSWWTLLWNLVNINNWELTKDIRGIMLLGSVIDYNFNNVLENRIPIYIAHWNRDSSISYKEKEIYYNQIKKIIKDYPIKVEIFDRWIHWTPIRMLDWRKSINWILEQNI